MASVIGLALAANYGVIIPELYAFSRAFAERY